MIFKKWFDEVILGKKKVKHPPNNDKCIDKDTYLLSVGKYLKHPAPKSTYYSSTTTPVNDAYIELLMVKTLDTKENKESINQLLTAVKTNNKAMLLFISKNSNSDNFFEVYIAKLAMTQLGITPE